jgi:hypothetical protein
MFDASRYKNGGKIRISGTLSALKYAPIFRDPFAQFLEALEIF